VAFPAFPASAAPSPGRNNEPVVTPCPSDPLSGLLRGQVPPALLPPRRCRQPSAQQSSAFPIVPAFGASLFNDGILTAWIMTAHVHRCAVYCTTLSGAQSAGLQRRTERKRARCTAVLLDGFFDPEDGSEIYLRNNTLFSEIRYTTGQNTGPSGHRCGNFSFNKLPIRFPRPS
jgi:hypothetical protein